MALHLKSTGIDFVDFSDPHAGMTNELLNDYEFGDYSPTITGSSGSTGQTYGGQEGIYNKVARHAYVSGYTTLTVEGSHTGNYPACAGLPFTSSSTPTGGINSGASSIARVEQILVSDQWVGPACQIGATQGSLLMMEHPANGTFGSHRGCGASYTNPSTALANDSSISMAVWYIID